MNNTVIEVLNNKHAKKVKKYWENKGFDTSGYSFVSNKEDGDECRYYGVLNNTFGAWDLEAIGLYKGKIIELPKTTEELPIPRMVMVRDSQDEEWNKEELLADLSRLNVEYPFICRSGTLAAGTYTWRQMKELPTEITKAEAEKMLSELKGIEIKIL